MAVDKNGDEAIFSEKPVRDESNNFWDYEWREELCISLPKGSIEKLIGYKLTWRDEPVELQ